MSARQPHARAAAGVDGRRIERLRQLAHLLDDRFAIPGTRYRIGLDGLIGLVPGIGDAVTTLLALYIVLEARRLGVPLSKLGRMGINVGLDAVLGAVPLVGDLFDVAGRRTGAISLCCSIISTPLPRRGIRGADRGLARHPAAREPDVAGRPPPAQPSATPAGRSAGRTAPFTRA